MSLDTLNDEVKGQIQALEERERRLRKWNKSSVSYCGSIAATGGLAWVVSLFLGPDQYPSTVDIPAELLTKFSDTVATRSGGGGGLDGLSAISSASETLGAIVPYMTGMGAVVGIVMAGVGLVRADMGAVFRGVAAALIMGTTPIFFNVLTGGAGSDSGSSSSATVSPREQFSDDVASAKFDAVRRQLNALSQGDTPQGLYVLAQVVLSDDALRTTQPMPITADVANKVAAGKDFEPAPEALYAIERAAFGSPKSESALAYETKHVEREKFVKGVAGAGFKIFVLAALISGGLFAARKVISRRMNRIYGLLGLKPQ